jgi:hypothetical protein
VKKWFLCVSKWRRTKRCVSLAACSASVRNPYLSRCLQVNNQRGARLEDLLENIHDDTQNIREDTTVSN